MTTSATTLAIRGAAAAELLLDEGIEAGPRIDDPHEREFADAVVDGLSKGMAADRRGWVRNIMDGTGRLARNLNVEPEHGLIEVIQNADDLGATCVRFCFLPGPPREVLVVHDGTRVQAPHVLAMTLALVSTKGDDALATGKFGIGLKTLTRLAEAFEVHSQPYSFRVADQRLSTTSKRASLPSLWNREKPETLLSLALRSDYPDDGLGRWFGEFSADSLLFLHSVRRLEFRGPDGELIAERELSTRSGRPISLTLGDIEWQAEEEVLYEPEAQRTWVRLSAERPVPSGLERTDKATLERSPLAVAYADTPVHARLYAGLPLAVGATLPFALNAQFDTDASRTTMVQERWNEWVLDELGSLTSAAALHRLREDPRTAWNLVPLKGEVRGVGDTWLRDRLERLVDGVQTSVREDAILPTEATLAPLRTFIAEAHELEGLLTDHDLRRLAGDHHPLLQSARDAAGRWRTVSDELEVSDRVSVRDALRMFGWPEEQLGDRPVEWFVRLAATGLRAGLGKVLETSPFVWVERDERVSPQDARAQALLLVTEAAGTTLGHRLGVVQPVGRAFLAEGDDAEAVRDFLRRTAGLRAHPSDADALRALSDLDRSRPLPFDDEALLALRDALRQLSPDELQELGPRIGRRITVDGRAYEGGRPRNVRVRPAEAYLPASMVTGRETWAKAAGTTSGVLWVHPRYARDLRPARRRSPRDVIDLAAERAARTAAQQQRLGARSLFSDLGAETAPRLVKRKEDISRHGVGAASADFDALPAEQRAAFSGRASEFSGLMNDYVAPDLEAVCNHIAKAKVAEARPRAFALLAALNRAWSRLYATRTMAEAVNAYITMNPLGPVPATWRARAAGTRWMTNQAGGRRPPRELSIRTPAFLAMLGEAPRLYAYQLEAKDSGSSAVRALGFESEPRATTLVARLEELRKAELRGDKVDDAAVARLYAALAAAAPEADAKGARRRVDNVPLGALRRQFQTGPSQGAGLVRAGGRWLPPQRVFIGRPLFGRYGDFVPDEAERLWRLLDMRRPDIADCVAVLRRIVEDSSGEAERGLLWEVYRYLAALLGDEDRAAPSSLRRLWLWTPSGWSKERPMFAVADPELQQRLAAHVSVWEPPGRLDALLPLIEPFGLTSLPEESFRALGINTGALAAGRALEPRLRNAIAHLQEWLALNDPDLYDRLPFAWDELRSARVALNKGLHVEVPIPGRSPVQVARRAHVERSNNLLFALAGRDVLDDHDVIGARLAYLFGAEDREQVILAHGWLQALRRADRHEALTGVKLSETATESGSDGASSGDGTPGPRTGLGREDKNQREQAPAGGGEQSEMPEPERPVAPRKLKRLDDITVGLEWVEAPIEGAGMRESGAGTSGGETGLVEPSGGDGFGQGDDSGGYMTAPASWTPEERETLGLKLVARELDRRHGLRLTDIRKQKSVGADAMDQHGTYYELKVHAGALPDAVSLTPSEFQRAQQDPAEFVLVAVAGLEEGFTPSVKLIPDPLNNLSWSPEVDVQVSGVRAAEAAPPPAPQEAEPQAHG